MFLRFDSHENRAGLVNLMGSRLSKARSHLSRPAGQTRLAIDNCATMHALSIYLYYLSRKHIRIKKITLINNIKTSEAVSFNKDSIFKIKTNIAFPPYKIVWEILIALARLAPLM
jgi:hypothetical protein